jgi:hypothetical protein
VITGVAGLVLHTVARHFQELELNLQRGERRAAKTAVATTSEARLRPEVPGLARSWPDAALLGLGR